MAAVVTNLDLLEWFDESERAFCRACGHQTAVQLPEARATFCLGCGAVSVDGVRLDTNGRFDLHW